MTDTTTCCQDEKLSELTALIRNCFFYGKQMGVAQFRRDQVYHRHQAWLLNRLLIGPGILCGLDVAVVEGVLTVSPGVALDGLGRVIIVPEATAVTVNVADDPFHAKLWLCYCERCILPAPTCGDPCHPNTTMEYDAIEESFRLDVRPVLITGAKGVVAKKGLATSKPITPPSQAPKPPVSGTAQPTGDCGVPDELCVALAKIKVAAEGIEVGARAARRASPLELEETVGKLARKIAALEAALEELG